jgi:hypothetical protein
MPWTRVGRRESELVRHALLGVAVALCGCASAGGTAGVLDIGSVWYKHPKTGDVKECGGGFYPGVQIRRYNCGKRYLADGYVEVEKCKAVSLGTMCVTEAEMARSENQEASVAERLRELEKLRDQRLITDEEYQAKRRQILDRL